MLRVALSVVLVAACGHGAGTPATAPPARVDSRADAAVSADADVADAVDVGDGESTLFTDGAPITCPAGSVEQVGACLQAGSYCNTRVNDLERDKVPDVALLRTESTGCADVYLLVKHVDKWRAVRHVEYLQGHGMRNTELTLTTIRYTRKAGLRITEVVYHLVEDTVAGDGSIHTESDSTIACTWPGNGDEPSCQ